MGLGTAVSLDDAARIGGLDLVLPTDPAIGPPDAAYTLANRVALVWSERPGLPADPDFGVGLLLSEFRGHVDDGYYQKTLSSSAQVTPVTVSGHSGYWISGAPHFFYYVDPSGKAVDDSHRIVGDTLIWADGDVTYRLESRLGRGGGDPPRRIAPLAGTAAGPWCIGTDGGRSGPPHDRRGPPPGANACATTEPSSSPVPPRQPPRRLHDRRVLAGRIRRASPRPPTPSTPPAASRPASPGFGGRDAILVLGREGDPLLTAIVASSGEQLVQLPVGVPTSASWGSLATTTASGGRTIVADADIVDGGGSTATLDGAWAPPTIGDDPTPTGLSADGKTLVLIPAGDPDPARTTSRFAIVPFPPIEGAPQLAPRVVELPGAVDFDAISPDGRILYVVQHLDGEGGYQVRAVDLPAGTMRPDIITDKRNLGEAMAGWPLAQLRSPTGMVMTLYRGTDHPFIHALDTAEAWAVCIDLPGGGSATDDADWGLAASTGGARSMR